LGVLQRGHLGRLQLGQLLVVGDHGVELADGGSFGAGVAVRWRP
jgi:hypothetical protein